MSYASVVSPEQLSYNRGMVKSAISSLSRKYDQTVVQKIAAKYFNSSTVLILHLYPGYLERFRKEVTLLLLKGPRDCLEPIREAREDRPVSSEVTDSSFIEKGEDENAFSQLATRIEALRINGIKGLNRKDITSSHRPLPLGVTLALGAVLAFETYNPQSLDREEQQKKLSQLEIQVRLAEVLLGYDKGFSEEALSHEIDKIDADLKKLNREQDRDLKLLRNILVSAKIWIKCEKKRDRTAIYTELERVNKILESSSQNSAEKKDLLVLKYILEQPNVFYKKFEVQTLKEPSFFKRLFKGWFVFLDNLPQRRWVIVNGRTNLFSFNKERKVHLFAQAFRNKFFSQKNDWGGSEPLRSSISEKIQTFKCKMDNEFIVDCNYFTESFSDQIEENRASSTLSKEHQAAINRQKAIYLCRKLMEQLLERKNVPENSLKQLIDFVEKLRKEKLLQKDPLLAQVSVQLEMIQALTL